MAIQSLCSLTPQHVQNLHTLQHKEVTLRSFMSLERNELTLRMDHWTDETSKRELGDGMGFQSLDSDVVIFMRPVLYEIINPCEFTILKIVLCAIWCHRHTFSLIFVLSRCKNLSYTQTEHEPQYSLTTFQMLLLCSAYKLI